jgi:putative addiction module killer protein
MPTRKVLEYLERDGSSPLYRIDFGPGYRIYLGQQGDLVIILLGGGTKKGQGKDIQQAQQRWRDYKSRKKR